MEIRELLGSQDRLKYLFFDYDEDDGDFDDDFQDDWKEELIPESEVDWETDDWDDVIWQEHISDMVQAPGFFQNIKMVRFFLT